MKAKTFIFSLLFFISLMISSSKSYSNIDWDKLPEVMDQAMAKSALITDLHFCDFSEMQRMDLEKDDLKKLLREMVAVGEIPFINDQQIDEIINSLTLEIFNYAAQWGCTIPVMKAYLNFSMPGDEIRSILQRGKNKFTPDEIASIFQGAKYTIVSCMKTKLMDANISEGDIKNLKNNKVMSLQNTDLQSKVNLAQKECSSINGKDLFRYLLEISFELAKRTDPEDENSKDSQLLSTLLEFIKL